MCSGAGFVGFSRFNSVSDVVGDDGLGVSDSASPWEQLRLANRLGLIISRLPGLNCKMNSSFCTLGLGASSKD